MNYPVVNCCRNEHKSEEGLQTTEDGMIPAVEGVVVSGAVRRTDGYRRGVGECWAAIGKREDKLLHTENIKHFELRAVSLCTLRMLSGRVLTTRRLPQNRLQLI